MLRTALAALMATLLLCGPSRAAEPAAPPAMHPSAPVIRIERFDEVRATLEAAGLAVVEPRRSKTAEGRDFRELAFTDPDGHLVVRYQLD